MKRHTGTDTPRLIAESIERVVRSRTGGTIRGLRVEVDHGSVVVSGRVRTYYTKQLITHAALAAAEDVTLTNNIEVY